MFNTVKLVVLLLAIVNLGGCSSPRPMPFQLADSGSRIYQGTLFTDNQRIEVTIDGLQFSGFYIVATGNAFSEPLPDQRFFPGITETTFSTNSARAHLMADNGQQLNCQFLFESSRAVGDCQSPSGAIYQLFTAVAAKSK